MPIFDDTNGRDAGEKWNEIIVYAKEYRYAEQDGFNGDFVHWPLSLYMTWQSNSNTLAR